MNINLLNTNDSVAQEYLDIVYSYGYIPLNRTTTNHATRIATIRGNTSRTVIDHILTDLLTPSYLLSIHDNNISDHRLILFNINLQNISSTSSSQKITHLQYEKIDLLKLKRDLLTKNSFSQLIDECENIVNNNKITFELRPKNQKQKFPWMSKDLKVLIKKRDKFYKLKTKYPNNNYVTEQFRNLKKLCKMTEKSEKLKYFSDQLNSNDFSKLWSTMNRFVFNKSKSIKKITLIHNNNTIGCPKEIANIFNDYFINCVETIIPPATITQHNINQINIFHPFSFSPTTELEVHNILSTLKPSAAVGDDNLSTKFCQHIKKCLSEPLANIINNNICTGNFSNCLKTAKITPIYKNGDRHVVANYRPISILTVFSKVFERIIHKRLESHIVKNGLIDKRQFGFCSQSSTLAATTELLNSIKTNVDSGRITSCLFIDLTKAFDCVQHKLLLQKLQSIGIIERYNKLFENYLSERKQYVTVCNTKSELQEVKYGVPQGSILGPTLFNIFVNDIFSLNLNGQLLLYADDMVVVFAEKDIRELQRKMQEDINMINDWLVTNFLKINAIKTEYMIFEVKNKILDLSNFKLSINNSELKKVFEFKYLGLWLDSKLNWTTHVIKLKDKLRKINFILYRMRDVLPNKTKYMIYHSHILSNIRYLLPIWGTTAKNRLAEIQILMNKSLKNIRNLPLRTPSSLLYNEKILNLKQIIDFELVLLIFKIKNGFIKNNFLLNLCSDLHRYETRQANNYQIAFCRTSVGQNNPLLKGLYLFNNLPANLKEEPRISIFKKKLQSHIHATME